jgi:hypothetical protein
MPVINAAFSYLVNPVEAPLPAPAKEIAAVNRIVVGNFNTQENQKDGNVKACR